MTVDLLRGLAEGIGPRMSGSPEAFASATLIANAFKELELEPHFQEFEFLAYDPDEPSLEVDGKVVAAGPCTYSHPTPEGGISGKLRYLGRHVVLAELFEPDAFSIEDDGGELGRLYGNPLGGEAGPFTSGYGQLLTGPAAYISTADSERLKDLIGSTVSLRTRGRFLPGRRDRNVLAWLPGDRPGTVIISAHFDSVWRGPGAVDNASGVEGMLRVARALVAGGPDRHSFLFVAFAAEEGGLFGSRFFAIEARLRRDPDPILGVVNLDSIARGDRFVVRAGPVAFRERVLAIAATLGLEQRYELVGAEPAPASDDYSFATYGIPTVSLLHWPYPEYHLPSDRIELVDASRLADSVKLATALALHLAAPGLRL